MLHNMVNLKKNHGGTTVTTKWMPMFHMKNVCVDVGIDSLWDSALQKALLASNHLLTRIAYMPTDVMWPFKLSVHLRCRLK